MLVGLEQLKAEHERHREVLNTYQELETNLKELQV